MKTQKTSDYSIFVYDEKNREVEPPQLKKIIKDMAKRGFIEAFPVIVTKLPKGKFKVCDGQHRLEAAKSLGIPVCYYVSDFEIDPATVPASKAWTKSNFIHRYATQGIEAYVKVVEAAKRTGVSISAVTSIMTDDLSMNRSQALLQGKMKIVNEVQSYRVLDTASAICNANSSLLINPVAKTLQKLSKLESITFAKLSERLITNANLIKKFTSVEIGITEFEAAYNWKLPYEKRVPIQIEINRIMHERRVAFCESK